MATTNPLSVAVFMALISPSPAQGAMIAITKLDCDSLHWSEVNVQVRGV
jgi:hypothetical protein